MADSHGHRGSKLALPASFRAAHVIPVTGRSAIGPSRSELELARLVPFEELVVQLLLCSGIGTCQLRVLRLDVGEFLHDLIDLLRGLR